MLSEEQIKLVEWMDAATGVGREVATGLLSVTRFSDAFWYLSRGINWSPGPGQQLPSVSVPAGFVTDFASIPRGLWTALPRDGDYVWAAVVHDYLYWYQTTTKNVADGLRAQRCNDRFQDSNRGSDCHLSRRSLGRHLFVEREYQAETKWREADPQAFS